jgi:hypothetical protein
MQHVEVLLLAYEGVFTAAAKLKGYRVTLCSETASLKRFPNGPASPKSMLLRFAAAPKKEI